MYPFSRLPILFMLLVPKPSKLLAQLLKLLVLCSVILLAACGDEANNEDVAEANNLLENQAESKASPSLVALCAKAFAVDDEAVNESTPLTNSHPLAQQIINVETGQAINCVDLLTSLSTVTNLLIGEQHGNEHHSQLETVILSAVAEAHPEPQSIALLMEMFNQDQQAVIDEEQAKASPNANRIASKLNWWQSAWPAFTHYEAQVQLALDQSMTIVAADIPDNAQQQVKTQGIGVISANKRSELKLNTKSIAAIQQSWQRSMDKAQCQRLSPESIQQLATLQYVRDAVMANALLTDNEVDSNSSESTMAGIKVLIAGNEHIRHDRSVPYQLQRLGYTESVVTIALIEAKPEKMDWQDYLPQDAWGKTYDYIWFTPSRDQESSCEKLERILGAK